MKSRIKYLVGVDEVGRGPIAGPVTVGVCVFFDPKTAHAGLRGIKDSKKLSAVQREIWSAKIHELKSRSVLSFHIESLSATQIDKKGIAWCIRICIARSILALKLQPEECEVRLDGGLKAPAEFLFQKTIIKGDEKEAVIGAASIMAKVSRDAFMKKQSRRFPHYGFEVHKGYGTKAHYSALSRLGISTFHRKSFLTKFMAPPVSRFSKKL